MNNIFQETDKSVKRHYFMKNIIHEMNWLKYQLHVTSVLPPYRHHHDHLYPYYPCEMNSQSSGNS